MKDRDSEYLHKAFLENLINTDYNGHSYMTDLIRLKDYRQICMSKVDSDDNDVDESYLGEHRFYIMADKMRRYLEANIEEYEAISKWELFVRLSTGEKLIFDALYNTVRFVRYEDDNLTYEQKVKEFARNLRKFLGYNFMTQEELADKVGISRVMMNKYMNGKAVPNAILANDIAKVLKCSVQELYYRHF